MHPCLNYRVLYTLSNEHKQHSFTSVFSGTAVSVCWTVGHYSNNLLIIHTWPKFKQQLSTPCITVSVWAQFLANIASLALLLTLLISSIVSYWDFHSDSHFSYTSVSHNVCTEPHIQPITNEILTGITTNIQDGAQLDITAKGFWKGPMKNLHQSMYTCLIHMLHQTDAFQSHPATGGMNRWRNECINKDERS